MAPQLRFLKRAAPGQMVALAAVHSLGLSLEVDKSENRRLCLSNKIFTYLLAGVPVLMSDMPAQRRLAADFGEAAAIIDLGDAPAAARTIDAWLASPGLLSGAREAAWRLGESRFNWDREREVFLASVDAALRSAA